MSRPANPRSPQNACRVCSQRELVLHDNCGNPNIVLRDRPSLSAQPAFDVAVVLSRRSVARKHGAAGDKFVDPPKILCQSGRLERSIIEFAYDDAGYKHFTCFSQTELYGRVSGEERYNNVGVEQMSASRCHEPSRTRLELLGS